MLTDMGEYFVGAYLRLIEYCDFVDYFFARASTFH